MFQLPDRPQVTVLTEQWSTLFVQLTIKDMGISIPLNPAPHVSFKWMGDHKCGFSLLMGD